jgi:hypothetical protein
MVWRPSAASADKTGRDFEKCAERTVDACTLDIDFTR